VKHTRLVIVAVAMLASFSVRLSAAPVTSLEGYKADARKRADAVWRPLSARYIDKVHVGTVKVAFDIVPDGGARNIKIVSNTGNKTLAEIAVRVIEETRRPPIPPGLSATLRGGVIHVEYDFTVHQ
jgi:TonB family protein